MSSVGFGLIKSLVSRSDPLPADMDESFFPGAEKSAFNFIKQHYEDFGSYPQLETICLEIQNQNCFDSIPDEPPAFWIDRVKERKRHNVSTAGLITIREKLESEDIDGAVDHFGSVYEVLEGTYADPEGVACETDPHPFPDVMAGLAGDFAALYSAYLESPREFFYMSFITCLGACLADKITIDTELKPQPRFYTILLGESADTRKSTALSKTVDLFIEAFSNDGPYQRWGGMGFSACFGIGSAEGLQRSFNSASKVLLCLDELKPFISKCKIENSVLLPCVNTLFENNKYENRTKKSHVFIQNAHLSLLAASTVDTWERIWTSAFTSIGFTNRLFIVPGSAARRFSLPQTIPQSEKDELIGRLRDMVRIYASGEPRRLAFSKTARQVFHEWYMDLPSSVHTKRLDTYGLRLMSLLSINQSKDEVDLETAQKAIRLCNWQLQVRQMYDPIDSDYEMAHIEEKIRRVLSTGPLSKRELQRKINYQRSGLWFFRNAIKNLMTNGEIKKTTGKKWMLTEQN